LDDVDIEDQLDVELDVLFDWLDVENLAVLDEELLLDELLDELLDMFVDVELLEEELDELAEVVLDDLELAELVLDSNSVSMDSTTYRSPDLLQATPLRYWGTVVHSLTVWGLPFLSIRSSRLLTCGVGS